MLKESFARSIFCSIISILLKEAHCLVVSFRTVECQMLQSFKSFDTGIICFIFFVYTRLLYYRSAQPLELVLL